MAVLSFNFELLDGNAIIEAVDSKEEAAYLAVVKEEDKKQKAEEKKRKKEEEAKRKQEEEEKKRKEQEVNERHYYDPKWAYSRRDYEKIMEGKGFYERLPKNYGDGPHYLGGCITHWPPKTDNSNGNTKGTQQVVVEKQQQEVQGGVQQGNNAQLQSNGGNGSRRTPNINGSQRRKLKKKNKGEEAAQQKEGDNNAPAAPAAGRTSAPASAVSVLKIVSELTLKEYEEEVVAKKKGLEAEKKSADGVDCERIKEFEAMQAIGKKKLEEGEEKKSSIPKPKEKSADQINTKKAISITEFLKSQPIKTQIININEPSRLKKDIEGQENGPSHMDGRFGGYQQSQRGGRFGGYQQSQRGGRFGGRSGYSQKTPVKHQPKEASINLAEFPPLGTS